MLSIVVLLKIKPDRIDRFRDAMLTQARNSLENEPACRQFDVCLDANNPARVLLYEVYDNDEAFQLHLASQHFRQFNETVKDWVLEKSVTRWSRFEG